MKMSEMRCQVCPAGVKDGPLYNTKSKDGWRCKKHLGDFQADATVAHIAETIHRGK